MPNLPKQDLLYLILILQFKQPSQKTLIYMMQGNLTNTKIDRENSPKQSAKTNQSRTALQAYELISDNWQILVNCSIKHDSIAQHYYEKITKIKVKTEKGCNGFYKVKLTVVQKDHFICFSSNDQVIVLSEVLNGKIYKKLDLKAEDQTFINLCEGEVLKKQFFLFGWQRGYLFISKAGLTYAKTRQGEPDLFISKIRQIWTRFQLIQDNKYIVFKTKHNLLKYEFAVPVQKAVKWGKAFCSLLQYQ